MDSKGKKLKDRLTYAYIEKIKRNIDCPNCRKGRMRINKDSGMWCCEKCGYKLSVEDFEDDWVFWFCDGCGAYLNNQAGFNRNASSHVCQNCGFINDITESNIKGECRECGKVLDDPDATLCPECMQKRIDRLMAVQEILDQAGVIANEIQNMINVIYEVDDSPNDNFIDFDEYYIDDYDDEEDYDNVKEGKSMRCPQCGKLLIGDAPDETIWFNCDFCGDRFLLEDGILVNVMNRGRKGNSHRCISCGGSLDGGEYVAPWADGDNSEAYVICPHCKSKNFLWD